MNLFIKKYYLPVCLVLINIIIKTIFISSESISHDEPFTIYHAQFDFFNIIHYLKNYNNPPLYELLLHFWIKLFGISAFAVRFLPMLFSSFSVWFIYKIGERFFDKNTGLVASLLFTFSTMQIWYAHDSRVYSLFLLLTLVSFFLFFKLLQEQQLSKTNSFFLILVNVLILYAHYFGFFILLLEALIVFVWFLKNKNILYSFVKIILVILVFYIPQIIVLFDRFFTSAKNGTWLKVPSGLESLYNMIWSFTNAPVVAVTAIILLIVGFSKFLVFAKFKIENPFVKYVTIWFLFPFFFMFFVSYKIPMFLDRYLIFITPAFYLLLAISVKYVFQKKNMYYALSILLIGAFVVSSSFNPNKKRLIKETVEFVKSKKHKNTIVLVCAPDFMPSFVYYYNLDHFKAIDQFSEYGKMEQLMNSENVYFINRLDSTIYNKMKTFNEIIYLDAGADFSVPNNSIKNDLTNKCEIKEEQFFYELFNVYVFDSSKLISPN